MVSTFVMGKRIWFDVGHCDTRESVSSNFGAGRSWHVRAVDYMEKESQVLIRVETPAVVERSACPAMQDSAAFPHLNAGGSSTRSTLDSPFPYSPPHARASLRPAPKFDETLSRVSQCPTSNQILLPITNVEEPFILIPLQHGCRPNRLQNGYRSASWVSMMENRLTEANVS